MPNCLQFMDGFCMVMIIISLLRFLVKHKALQIAPLCLIVLYLLCHIFSGRSANSEQKGISQTIEQLIQFSYLLLKMEIFLVYSFSD